MPTDYCLWLQDRQRVQSFGSQAIKPDKHKAIDSAEGHLHRRSTAQHIELVAEDKGLSLQRGPRPELPGYSTPDQPAEIAHRADYQPIRRVTSSILGFR
jgi:hypothetical protein